MNVYTLVCYFNELYDKLDVQDILTNKVHNKETNE